MGSTWRCVRGAWCRRCTSPPACPRMRCALRCSACCAPSTEHSTHSTAQHSAEQRSANHERRISVSRRPPHVYCTQPSALVTPAAAAPPGTAAPPSACIHFRLLLPPLLPCCRPACSYPLVTFALPFLSHAGPPHNASSSLCPCVTFNSAGRTGKSRTSGTGRRQTGVGDMQAGRGTNESNTSEPLAVLSTPAATCYLFAEAPAPAAAAPAPLAPPPPPPSPPVRGFPWALPTHPPAPPAALGQRQPAQPC